jgi:hypothetical protein
MDFSKTIRKLMFAAAVSVMAFAGSADAATLYQIPGGLKAITPSANPGQQVAHPCQKQLNAYQANPNAATKRRRYQRCMQTKFQGAGNN